MDYPHCYYCLPQDLLRHHPWRFAGDIVDLDEHLLYVRFLPDVPLGSWRSFRV